MAAMASLYHLPEAGSAIRRMVMEDKCTYYEVCRELERSFPHYPEVLVSEASEGAVPDNYIHRTSRLPFRSANSDQHSSVLPLLYERRLVLRVILV